MSSEVANRLWGNKAKFYYLLVAASLLLFTLLGSREIWTQEHRWADIVSGMFFRHDFLHPYLNENFYYDKPLLSYWLIALLAKLTGNLSAWVLRIPSAVAGLIAVYAIYVLGSKIKDKHLGLLASWLLLTTFYFLFWARTSSADMLNLAGSLSAIAWYYIKRDNAGYFDYAIFFLIIAFTSLCKGLVGAIIPLIAVFIDMLLQNSWKQHFRLPLLLSAIPAVIVYLLPFWASSYLGGEGYGENGLYLVYKENILRYFQPFDHQGPIYTYFIYLPIYLLPWTLFLFPALFTLPTRWKQMTLSSKWIVWTVCALFMFLTLSGSRRSYYVLPIIPYVLLMIADWLLSINVSARLRNFSAASILFVFALLFTGVDLLPAWYYSQHGIDRFAVVLKDEANKIKPWNTWNVVMLDAESKLNFYLQLPPNIKRYHVQGNRFKQTAQTVLQAWPIILNKPKNTIFVSRKLYAPLLKSYFTDYNMVELPQKTSFSLGKDQAIATPIAFIPKG